MQYAANKKRNVTLKKWNKCTKMNKEGQQGNEERGMKCQIVAPVVKDKWEEIKQEGPQWALPGSQSLTFPIWSPSLKSWQLPEALADFLMILASNTSLLFLWSLSVSYEILYSDALYKSLSHSLFIQLAPEELLYMLLEMIRKATTAPILNII